MGDRPQWAPPEVDLDHPSVARVYDFYLGGSHNFESDRAFARQVIAANPAATALVRDNRAFLRRAVRHLCEEGIDQFLDLGSGIPTEGNVHEVAGAARPESRVVYVDHDPIAVVHSNHLLEGDDRAAAVLADVRNVEQVLDLATRAGLDLDRPIGLLAVSLLHFLADADRPAELMARYVAALPSGSHLAISHLTGGSPAYMRAVHVYDRDESPNALWLRTTDEVAALFGDLELVAPGLVRLPLWRHDQDHDEDAPPVPDEYPYRAAVGRKP